MKFELVKSAQAAVDETDVETKNAEPAGAIHNDTGGKRGTPEPRPCCPPAINTCFWQNSTGQNKK